MYETDDEIRQLQELLTRSHAGMNPHMRAILTPDRALTARQVVTYLQGVKQVALATVSAAGAPRVAPLDALFIHGRFHLGTGGGAARVRHLRRQPRVSLTHFVGDEIAITVHGMATLLGRDHPDVAALEPRYVAIYGSSPFSWAEEVVLIRVEPEAMYATAPHPEADPDGSGPARPVRLVPARRS